MICLLQVNSLFSFYPAFFSFSFIFPVAKERNKERDMPAFPILSVSRKPVLLIIFFTVFVFLYNIASHPKVSKTMQANAYYTDYDERACLPQKLLIKKPPTKKAKAAMVILVRNK